MRPHSEPRLAAVRLLPRPSEDDGALLAALRAGNRGAVLRFFDRYGPAAERTLVRILGRDSDVAALLNDVFLRALRRIDRVDDASALGMWLTRIAVFTAKEHLRARRRRRWLILFAPSEVPDAESVEAPSEIREAVARLYRALDALPVDERLAFSLRHIEQMELMEVAEACDVSLATAKRRLARAEMRFGAIARRDPLLSEWIEGGVRWKLR